ncbi:MAG: LPD38 domain-containing protein, partial [Pseudomonadota bacterium]
NQPVPDLNIMLVDEDFNFGQSQAAQEALISALPSLRAELDRLSLKRVDLVIDVPGGERQGGFRMDVLGRMEILIGTSLDPEMTLHHEAIHAMRALNLFTAAEWEVLQQAASKGWVEKHDIDKRYPDLLPSEQIEEAIAEEFAASVKARRAPASSAITRVFNKIHRLLKAFGNALRGQGFQTAEDVFNRALSGEIGARQPFEGFREAISKDARQPVRRSAQAQAHASTSMMGQSAFIPNRGIWDELVRQNSGIWARLRGAGAAAYDHVDSARIRIQDRFLPVLRAQEAIIRQTGQALPEEQNAYLAEETFSGKVGRHLFEIDEDYTKPIIDIMAGKKGERGLDPDEVGQWLYARHAIERNDAIAQINLQMPDGGSGMSNAEAQDILTDAAAGPNAARLQEIGRLIDKLRERTLTLRENSGLITPQEASMWRNQYQFYVPLKGFADTDNSEAYLDISGVGRRFNTKGPETKRALGRQSEAFNPLQAALTQAQEVAIRAEKNVVGQALYRLAKENPSPKLWKIKTPKQKRFYNRTTGLVESRTEDPISLFMDPNEMAVKVAGKEHRVLFQDERLARSAGSVGADQMGWFMGLMSQASRWFSAVNTMLDPEFVIRNAVRDMQAAQINVRNFGKDDRNAIGKAMLKNWPKAFVGAYRGQMNKADSEWTRYYKEFEASGAKVSFWRLEQPEAAREDLKRRLNLKGGNIAQRASKFVRISTRYNPVLGFIERTNLAVDNAVRLAAYVEARKKGWAKSDAASLSKNMTVNFNRRGEWGATINALYPFANAGIQGTQILFRAMTSRRMAKYAAGLVGMGLILDLVNAQLSEEDEDGELAYDKIPDWKNQMNLTVMLGPESDNAATFWMPYGYNMFPYMGQQIGKIARGVKEPGDALADFASAAFGAFSPMGGRDFQSVITPTMLDPINEMAMNEDWLGRPIRPENPWNDYGPNAYKYFSGVSDASRRVADVANRATGGSVAESGWLDVSPEYIDHAFGFVTGGAGRFVGRTSDTVGKLLRGEADQIESRNIPFYRSVQYEAGDWLDRERYYRFRDEVKSAQDALKTYQEAGVPVPQNVRKLASLNKMVNQSDKLLRESRKRKRLIEGREDGSDDQKQRAIKRIEENSTKVYLRFNKAFLERMGPQGE